MVVPLQEFVFVTVGSAVLSLVLAVLGLSVQDVGSAVLASVATLVALLLGVPGQPRDRTLGAAAIVGLITLIIDRFA